jgi:hypothetical protein
MSRFNFKVYTLIEMIIKELGWEGVKLGHVPQERDQWQVFGHTVIKFRFTK